MKTVIVNGQIVQINSVAEDAALDRHVARAAVRMLYGRLVSARVVDNERGYKVTQHHTRRMTAEEEYEAGID